MFFRGYRRKKNRQLVSLLPVGGGAALVLRRFDAEEGTEVSPEVIALDIKELQRHRASLQSLIQDLDELISDVQNL